MENIKTNETQATLKKMRNNPVIYAMRKFFKFIAPRIEIFHLINLVYWRLLLTRTQYYQPLYNFSIIRKKQPERICRDRADAIYQAIQPSEQKKNILDIGCNFGYFSHYFADRGNRVMGIDMNPNHIAICNLLNRVNHHDVHFAIHEFSESFLTTIQSNQYDIVFLFSVIHHIIHAKGLDYAQSLIAQLLEKIPVLFIELATKNEPLPFPWQASLPDDELAIFAKCPDISIKKLGQFSAQHGTTYRPLYQVSRHAKS